MRSQGHEQLALVAYLVLLGSLLGLLVSMIAVAEVTDRAPSKLWFFPLGAMTMLIGLYSIYFRAELAEVYLKLYERYPSWLRTFTIRSAHVLRVLHTLVGVSYVILGVWLLVDAVSAIL